jgi:hypothetical protein
MEMLAIPGKLRNAGNGNRGWKIEDGGSRIGDVIPRYNNDNREIT